jgi:hypothetical protein
MGISDGKNMCENAFGHFWIVGSNPFKGKALRWNTSNPCGIICQNV